MNPSLERLLPYPFTKLRGLLGNIQPCVDYPFIDLSIGEPQHAPPECILHAWQQHQTLISKYPTTAGLPELRQHIAMWLMNRFPSLQDQINADTQVLPVNGTREALFAIAQTLINRHENASVMMPNPFYQIYEGAALLAEARPYYVDFSVAEESVPALEEIPAHVWQSCQLLYLCSPANPSGEVIPQPVFEDLITLAHKYDFMIVSDECYSEIYFDEQHPPNGLLHASQEMGNKNFARCLAMYSLSKRSNAPGLRSGMVAGDADLLAAFLQYRTYHGCSMPLPTQYASIAAWRDENHVIKNRKYYRSKFTAAQKFFDNPVIPSGGFYLWLPTPIGDPQFVARLYREYNVKVLPGRYLAREVDGHSPGDNYIRVALVADEKSCTRGIELISQAMQAF